MLNFTTSSHGRFASFIKTITGSRLNRLLLVFAFAAICSDSVAQSPYIVVDGTNVLASENTKFPFWLTAGSTIAAGSNVISVSVIEYTITPSPAGENILQFVGPRKITTVQTVPAGKTWKVEAALLNPVVGTLSSGWTDDGTVVRLTTTSDNVGIGNITPTQKLDVTGKIAVSGKEAIDGGDSWLRLNQSSQFTSGTYTPGHLRSDGGIASGGVGSLGGGTINATSTVNTATGFRIGNTATAGNYLRGNGSDFVSSAIQVGDLPGGSGNYIQNQVGSAQSANYWISGEARTSDWFRNINGSQGLYNHATGRHFYSESTNYWTVADANGLIFRNNHAGTITGYVYWDGTAGSNNFGLLSPSGNWRVRVDNGSVETHAPLYTTTCYIPFQYDRDNTGYYVDPNSTSRMYYGDYNYLHTTNDSWFPYTGNNWNYFRGSTYAWNATWYDENDGAYYVDPNGTSRYHYLGRNYGWNWTEYDWNDGAYYTDLNGTSRFHYLGRNYGWNWTEYDWNDGNYYTDLNSGSRFNYLGRNYGWNWTEYDWNDSYYYSDLNSWNRLYGIGSFYLRNNYDVSTDHQYGMYFAEGLSTAYAIFREGGGWGYPYPDLRIAFHTGIKLGANYSYSGIRMYTDYDMSDLVMAVNDYATCGYHNVLVNGYLYAWNFYYWSSRTRKHDIVKFEDSDYESSLAFVDDLNLNYYRYNESDLYPGIQVGFIAEETPTALTDEDNKAVSVAKLSFINTGAIKTLKKKVEDLEGSSKKISDFGVEEITSSEKWVNFAEDFKDQLNGAQPVVTATPSQQGVSLSISNVTKEGFMVKSDRPSAFNWIAMAKTTSGAGNQKTVINEKFAAMLETAKTEKRVVPPLLTEPVAGTSSPADEKAAKMKPINEPAKGSDKASPEEVKMLEPDLSKEVKPAEGTETPNLEEKPEIKQRAEEDMRKFVPADESSPMKGDPNPPKEGAPR